MSNSLGRVFYLKLGIVLAFFAAFFGIYNFTNRDLARASVMGPAASYTGAPGESNCTQCHIGEPVNSGGGSVAISGLPVNYLPNQQYSVTVTVNHFNASIYGFETTALDKLGGEAGTFTIPLQKPATMQIIDGNVEERPRKYVEHTRAGTGSMTPNTKSWTFNWTAPSTRKGKIGFYAAGNGANADGDSTGDFIYTGNNATYSGTPVASSDGDGKTDLAVFRPGTSVWYSLNSTDGGFNAAQFGQTGDKIVPGDYDGDGKADRAIWRPSNGVWFILKSSDGGLAGNAFGMTGDIPAQGDYDGDGKTDMAVFRPSTGIWYILMIGTGQVQILGFGLDGDKPVPGDYDADGKTDIAVYRPSTGNWYILQSSNGALQAFNFGLTGDRPVPGDYDGDGKTDAAIYRPSNGVWFILKSSDGGLAGNQFGLSTDTPCQGDYDGDGLTDIAVYRDGTWYVLYSGNGSFAVFFFGSAGDIPTQSGYAPQ
jgi:hypothetical protein